MAIELRKMLQDLYQEKERIERAIASLESLLNHRDATPPLFMQKRGRKSMGAAERREVSERMKKYWADRRKKERRAVS
jgi:hypothetical protein